MSKQRMGGMKLSGFSGIQQAKQQSDTPAPLTTPEPESDPTVEPTPTPTPAAKKRSPRPKKEERLVVVNIKITESQQEWLADTAKTVRQNNDAPVPPSDRVYPQHLIGVAIELLKSVDVNWDEIRTAEDLKKHLKLL